MLPAWALGLVTNRYFLGAVAITAVIGSGWWWHSSKVSAAVDAVNARRDAEIEAQKARYRGEIAEWLIEMSDREARHRHAYAKLAAERREIFITLEKEIPVYVTNLADSRCIVPYGFVLIHDAAAAARAAAAPPAAGGSVDADSGLALSSVAGTVSANYAICHDAIAEVKRWREWYAEFSAEWEKLRAKFKENP